MGQVRLWVDASGAAEEVIPLPEHWDELDEDERRDWVRTQANSFRNKQFLVGIQISE